MPKVSLPAARKAAEKLATIPDCPRGDTALDLLAEDLAENCRDESEMNLVVQEARRTWKKWQGTAGLVEIIEAKRRKTVLPPEREVIDLGPRPKINCRTCHDFGWFTKEGEHVFCDCAAGVAAKQEWPDLTSRTFDFPGVRPQVHKHRPTQAQVEADFRRRQKQAESAMADAERTIADPEKTEDSKEIARETLRSLRRCG